jgi:hypothetical protein
MSPTFFTLVPQVFAFSSDHYGMHACLHACMYTYMYVCSLYELNVYMLVYIYAHICKTYASTYDFGKHSSNELRYSRHCQIHLCIHAHMHACIYQHMCILFLRHNYPRLTRQDRTHCCIHTDIRMQIYVCIAFKYACIQTILGICALNLAMRVRDTSE